MSKRPACPPGMPWLSPYLIVRDADAALDFYQNAFGFEKWNSLSPPEDMFWGDRTCKLLDPDGHCWNFATNVSDFDPTKMPH